MSKWFSPMDRATGRDKLEGDEPAPDPNRLSPRPTWFPTPPSPSSGPPDGKGAVTVSKYPRKEIRISPNFLRGRVSYSWRIVLVHSPDDLGDTLDAGSSYPDMTSAFRDACLGWDRY